MDAGEPDELLDRSSDRGDHIVQVELDDFLAGARAGVPDLHGGGELAVGGDLLAADLQIAHLEGGVGTPVTEGKQGGRVEVRGAAVLRAERRLEVRSGLATRGPW